MDTAEELQKNIEAILFAAENPVKTEDLTAYLNKNNDTIYEIEYINSIIETIIDKYKADFFPFEIGEVGGGFQFLTKANYHHTVSGFLNRNTIKRLSQAAIESLSIIAYKQPITKNAIEAIRGVNSDYTVQKLLEKELIEMAGRSNEPGKPLLFKTTQHFLDYFGINDLNDLPKLKEFEETENQIGEKENINATRQN